MYYRRHFRLHLQRQRNLFAKDFEVFIVDEDNTEKRFSFDTSGFYEGFVVGGSSLLVRHH